VRSLGILIVLIDRGMGDVLASKGDDDEATGYYERAGRQITKVLGMRHPEVIGQVRSCQV
jgi:hypothetical protein